MKLNNPLFGPLASALLVACMSLAPAATVVKAREAKAAKEVKGAKTGAAFPKGQYAALNALPDWGGVWTLNLGDTATRSRSRPELKGKYLEDYQAYQRAADANHGIAPRDGSNCLPPGLPGIMAVGQYPIEFLFTPGRVTTHHEAWMQWRIIFTDGRPHPPKDEWEPTFYGHSIGRWEGDTLVVDTVGIKETVPLMQGMKHSDQIHIVERIYLSKSDPDVLMVEVTVDDPLALAKPWTRNMSFNRHREWELVEFICAENDRNPVGEDGHTLFH